MWLIIVLDKEWTKRSYKHTALAEFFKQLFESDKLWGSSKHDQIIAICLLYSHQNIRIWPISSWYMYSCFLLTHTKTKLQSASSRMYEPPHDNTNKMICAPSEDSDQPRHRLSLIRVFAVRMKKHWFLSYPFSTLQRLWVFAWHYRSFCWFCHEAAHNVSTLSILYNKFIKENKVSKTMVPSIFLACIISQTSEE